jgi:cold shock CspA family protein/ribosome-associated translation inhibitor RaiA
MEVPIEISFRGVERTPAMEKLIREQAEKLEQVCDHLTSVRVTVEKPQEHLSTGNPYRVRVIARIPPGHELVASREPGEGDMHAPVEKVIRETFHAVWRQVKEIKQRQRGEVKKHPAQETAGIVVKLFKEEGYGFILAPEGHEIYFHQNSVLHGDFDRMSVGVGVRYLEESGNNGPQASTVDIVDKPGQRAGRGEQAERRSA